MHDLSNLIARDMAPSLGVTEPGAIALAVSRAYACIPGSIQKIIVYLNSGMYKNVFSCGIPRTNHTGAAYAAALGAINGDPSLGLEVLKNITPQNISDAEKLVQEGCVRVYMTCVSSDIYIRAEVTTAAGSASVVIEHSHTNITSVVCNGETIERLDPKPREETDDSAEICRYTLRDLYEYARGVPEREIAFIDDAFTMNLALLKAGLEDERTVIAHRYYALNHDSILSGDPRMSAQLLASGAIEARVLGVGRPAMSITGSGSHGIIATMPLYAFAHCVHESKKQLLQAAAFSILITQYIKAYSGKLSALCGCGVAAGTGAACGLALLQGGTYDQVVSVLNNMALGITGMICDGGNHGCAIKSAMAVDAAFQAVDWAMHGIDISAQNGICSDSPEGTMRNIGLIASPGMLGTEDTIIHIMNAKLTQ